jgi:hypothetical protein
MRFLKQGFWQSALNVDEDLQDVFSDGSMAKHLERKKTFILVARL